MKGSDSKVINLSQLKVACQDCNLYQLCLPVGIEQSDLEELDRIIKRRRPVPKGEHLFQVDDPFTAVYAVRSGSIKSYTPTADGQVRALGLWYNRRMMMEYTGPGSV